MPGTSFGISIHRFHTDTVLADQLAMEVDRSVALAAAIPSPFDLHLRDTIANDEPGRAAVLRTIESLENQTDTIVAAAEEVGITITVS